MTAISRSTLILTALLSAPAGAIEFQLHGGSVSGGFGNARTQTLEGVSVTATAWSTTGRGNRYQTAELGVFGTLGMGVCNRDEGPGCGARDASHALDNAAGKDLILFSFSAPVRLGGLTLAQIGTDSDLSLWAGTTTPDLEGSKSSSLGAATHADSRLTGYQMKTVDLSGFSGQYNWLAVSSRLAQANDIARLHKLTVYAPVTPVPEADTWAMLMAGLGLVGYTVRRRARPQ
jgi:hypothetical protein